MTPGPPRPGLLGGGWEAGPSVFLFPVTIASSEAGSRDEGDWGKLP